MRVPNFYGWIKADGIVELPDKPFLIWTRTGLDLVYLYLDSDGSDSGFVSLMSKYWYSISEVLYYRLDIQGPEGEDLFGIDWTQTEKFGLSFED